MNKIIAKKRFGQNFLNDKKVLEKIANVIDLQGKNIIEIGPGMGSLTQFLLQKSEKVVAFEIDYHLQNYLSKNFNFSNFELIKEDFLKADLSQYSNFQIVANIPYNISTDILFKIFQYHEQFENVVLLVQKEFAQRVCAKPNTKEYSKLAPSTKLFYDAKYCFDVSPDVFIPKPKVTSAVIHLTRSSKKYDIDYNEFLKFLKISFSMRRKTLWNNLKSQLKTKQEFENIIKNLNIDVNTRPENLTFEQYIDLFKNIYKNKE